MNIMVLTLMEQGSRVERTRRKVHVYKYYSFTHTNYLIDCHGPEIWIFQYLGKKLVI